MRNLFLFTCLAVIAWCLHASPLVAQEAIFEVRFNGNLQSTTGENPANAAGSAYAIGFKQRGLNVTDGAVLKYSLPGNMLAAEGSMTIWVKPNWVPGPFLRRILVVEGSPVFEVHVDESASLVFAMFSDQIETRVASGYVGDWNAGDWHFLSINWDAARITLYVDGVKINETAVGFEIPSFSDGLINVGSSAGNDAFDGVLDELRIYDSPLSGAEINALYQAELSDLPEGSALTVMDRFGRDVTERGLTLVDWEGPVRNPALEYSLKGSDALRYPVDVTLSTNVEQTSFNLPSTISSDGPSKTVRLSSESELASFLFSYYMDEDSEAETFDLRLTYNQNGLPSQQLIPVYVLDQDYARELSYPISVDFSLAVDDFMLSEDVQAVVKEAAEDWMYYVDGEGFDSIPAGGSTIGLGGQDHNFEEGTYSNPAPYSGFYLFAYENTVSEGCVCSTGFPNRELLQTRNGETVPVFRVGGLHLNQFGQAFETIPTGWEIVRPYDNWTQEGFVGSDVYTLAKHEIGHAIIFEESPLFLEARLRGGFISDAITEYYPGGIIPLFPDQAHIVSVLDPASQSTPYGGGVVEEVMPLGREMLTKVDILIMEAVGYPLRENEVTKPLTLTSSDMFRGELRTPFSARLEASGGIPVYEYSVAAGSLPAGVTLDSFTGLLSGSPAEEGQFPVTFLARDYTPGSEGVSYEATLEIKAGTQAAFAQQVQQMYVAYYGRPGDPGGVTFWAGRLAEAGGNWITDLVNAFGTSPEYTERFGALSPESLLNNLYQQLFNRPPDPGGLAFYLDLLSGSNLTGFNPTGRTSTLAQIALDVANGALGPDRVMLNNKIDVSLYFTNAIFSADTPYTSAEIDAVADIVGAIDATADSVTDGYAAVDLFIKLFGFSAPSVLQQGEEIVLIGAGYGPSGVALDLFGGSVSDIISADLSPDGQTIWVMAIDDNDPTDEGWGFYIMDRNGSNVVRKPLPPMGGSSDRPEVVIADEFGAFGYVAIPYFEGNDRHYRFYSTTWDSDTGLTEKLDTFEAAQIDATFPESSFANFALPGLRAVPGVEGFYFPNGNSIYAVDDGSPGQPIRVGYTQDVFWNGERPDPGNVWQGLDVGGGRWISNLALTDDTQAVVGGELVGTVFSLESVASGLGRFDGFETGSDITDDGRYASYCLLLSSDYSCFTGEYAGQYSAVPPVFSTGEVTDVGLSEAGNRLWGYERFGGGDWLFVADRETGSGFRAGANLDSYGAPVLDEDGDTLLVVSRFGNGIQFRNGLSLISYQPAALSGPMPALRNLRLRISEAEIALDVAVNAHVNSVRAQVFRGGYANIGWSPQGTPYPGWLGGSGLNLTRDDDGRYSASAAISGAPGPTDVLRVTAFNEAGNRVAFMDVRLALTE
jgi:hypothetical protein